MVGRRVVVAEPVVAGPIMAEPIIRAARHLEND